MQRPTVLSLFSGAGGLDLGLEAAGFHLAAAVERDPHCCRTLAANRPEVEVLESDVADVGGIELARSISGPVDLLAAGPPCQPFSKSGYWSRGDSLRLDDPRADTLTQFVRVLEEVRPRTYLLENVSGLVFRGKDEGMRQLLTAIADVNRRSGTSYSAQWRVLSAADFGVPQHRSRVFLVGSRDGRDFRFPAPTHEAAPGSLLGGEPHRTAWDALGDLPEAGPAEESLTVGGKWAGLLPSIPEGENYLFHTDRGGGEPLFGWRTRYWNFLLKLSKRRPSWTIQAQPGSAVGPFHWANRKLSERELLRLQTFPDDFRVLGGRTEVQRQIGNAVPSLLAEVLGRAIRNQFFGASATDPPTLLPPRRSDPPPPKPPDAVPARYLPLVGAHPAHPGTGRGPAARLRSN